MTPATQALSILRQLFTAERHHLIQPGTILTAADVGKMYRVPWSPNPHQLVEIRPRHCQMHGEFIGMEAGLRKKRNSEIRPWGSICMVMADDLRITEWEEPTP